MAGLQILMGMMATSRAEPLAEDVVENIQEIPRSEEQWSQLEQEHAQLQQELEEIRQNVLATSDDLARSETIITQLSIVIDTRVDEEKRIAAIRELNALQASQALPFYWTILGETRPLSLEILDGISEFSFEQEVVQIIEKGLQLQSKNGQSQTSFSVGKARKFGFYIEKPPELDSDLVLKTISVAGQLQQDSIAELLVDFSKDTSVPFPLRKAAFSTVENSYAEFLDENGRYELEKESNQRANQIYAASVATTTSVLLGSVGVWGQSDASQGIGYFGGFGMGLAGGYLYADQLYRPTIGQATMMASSVGWGLVQSSILADSLDLNNEQFALFQTLGVASGAGYSYWKKDRDVAVADVLELDFIGYLGAQMGLGLRDILGRPIESIPYPMYEDYVDFPYDERLTPEQEAQYNQAYTEYEEKVNSLDNSRQQALVLGSALGLALGHQIVPQWKVRPESIAFAGVYSLAFTSASLASIEAFSISSTDSVGIPRTGIHVGMGASLLYDHFHPVSYEQSLFTAYGSGIGHLLGSGLPLLFRANDQGIAQGVLWGGLASTAMGTHLGNQLDFTQSDWIMNGVGAGVSAWHFGALSSIVYGYGITKDDQDVGLFNTGLGLSGLGLVYAGTKGDLAIEDSLFLGTTTAWGAYYGGLLPIALNLELQSHEHLLMTLIASDIGLAAGAYGVFGADYDPKRSLVPQFLGVTGATLGALGTFLFTDDSQAVTANTLGWGTLGLAAGVLWERTKRESLSSEAQAWLPELGGRVTRNIGLQLAPQLDQNGDVGVYVGMYNRGF